ncbi:transposase [Bradyrhizobium sp. 195]|nr:transposase [Bradyrhizobium sp. 195]
MAHFVRDTVRTGSDLSAIMDVYDEERGFPPYHPGMMVALLLYAYSQGVYSSRKIARGCEERLDFAAVTGKRPPDFRTISEFRKRHLAVLSGLFRQVLTLCREAGLVKLGHVALDGTKIKANAGINKAMSYGRMKEAEPRLAAEVQRWFAEAAQTDKAEDRQFGALKRGNEMPDWMANREKRLEKIRAAKARWKLKPRLLPKPKRPRSRTTTAPATAARAGLAVELDMHAELVEQDRRQKLWADEAAAWHGTAGAAG